MIIFFTESFLSAVFLQWPHIRKRFSSSTQISSCQKKSNLLQIDAACWCAAFLNCIFVKSHAAYIQSAWGSVIRKENLLVQSLFGECIWGGSGVGSLLNSILNEFHSFQRCSSLCTKIKFQKSINKWDIFHSEKFLQRRDSQHFSCSWHCGRHFSGFTVIIYLFTFYRKLPSIPSAKRSAVSSLKTPCLMKYTICLSSAAFPPALTARGRAGTQGTTKPFRNIHEAFSSVFMA